MADVGRLESRLSAYRRRFGTRATIALVTAVGSVSSLAVCSLVYVFVGFPHGVENVLVGMGLPVFVPLVTAPPTLGLVLRAQQRSDELLAQVTYLVSHDPLTEVLNRRGFFSAMSDAGPGWRLVVVDVDDFKSVNDLLGHATGDAVLQGVARQLGVLLGPRGVVARFGGDEFVVAVPPDAAVGHRRLPARFQVPIPEEGQGQRHEVTCSLGFANIEHDEAVESALARADLSLYATKRSRSVGELA